MRQHTMEANHQVTGHTILTCPLCGYTVQIDNETLERKTLASGNREKVMHTWAMAGLGMGLSGDKAEPEGKDTPLDGPGCACGLTH